MSTKSPTTIKIPSKVALKGTASILAHIKDKIPPNTFKKSRDTGKRWVADFQDCIFEEKDIQEIKTLFKGKPWLFLKFPSVKKEIVDLLSPVKEDTGFTTPDLSSVAPLIKSAPSPTLTIATASADNGVPALDVKHSLERIKNEIMFVEEVVLGWREGKMTTAEMKGEDLLFALKKQLRVHSLDEEVIYAMNAFEESLHSIKHEGYHFKKVVHGNTDDSNSESDGNSSKSLLGDTTQANDDTSTTTNGINDDDGEIVYDENVEDDFAETQPWDI